MLHMEETSESNWDNAFDRMEERIKHLRRRVEAKSNEIESLRDGVSSEPDCCEWQRN